MDVAVVAGGELEAPCLGRLASFEKVIAVDGGLRHFKGVYPWVIVGDFDSATKEDLDRFAEVERVRYPQEKDQSDTDLALEYAFRHGASRVELFGALGGPLSMLWPIFSFSSSSERNSPLKRKAKPFMLSLILKKKRHGRGDAFRCFPWGERQRML
jgi:hypothetical protein